MIAEARAELDAGLYVDAAEVDAWIDSIGTEHELPLPRTRRLWSGGHVPRTLIFAPRARDDLKAHRRWLTQSGSGRAAWRRTRAIRKVINRLWRAEADRRAMRDMPDRFGPLASGTSTRLSVPV
jgi:hypothetical protein